MSINLSGLDSSEEGDERMLTRIRIEVEGCDSAQQVVDDLDKYEHSIQVTEAQRVRVAYDGKETLHADGWEVPTVKRDFFNEQLGREITDEVIEKDKERAGYKGRRVVQFECDVVGGLKTE